MKEERDQPRLFGARGSRVERDRRQIGRLFIHAKSLRPDFDRIAAHKRASRTLRAEADVVRGVDKGEFIEPILHAEQ